MKLYVNYISIKKKQLEIEGKLLYIIKVLHDKPQLTSYSTVKNRKLYIRNKTRIPTVTFLVTQNQF